MRFRFVATNETTGAPVNIGDTVVNFRGQRGILRSLDAARVPGKTGKVGIELYEDPTGPPTSPRDRMVYHYDSVWYLAVNAVPAE